MQTGRCNCGGVRFRVGNERETVLFCHCSICRRFSGHYWAATRAPRTDVTFDSDELAEAWELGLVDASPVPANDDALDFRLTAHLRPRTPTSTSRPTGAEK